MISDGTGLNWSVGVSFPERLSDRCRRRRIGGAEARIGTPRVIERASARTGSAGIFKHFTAQTNTPLVGEIMNDVGGDPVHRAFLLSAGFAAMAGLLASFT